MQILFIEDLNYSVIFQKAKETKYTAQQWNWVVERHCANWNGKRLSLASITNKYSSNSLAIVTKGWHA